jgi:DNA replication protein DnaC
MKEPAHIGDVLKSLNLPPPGDGPAAPASAPEPTAEERWLERERQRERQHRADMFRQSCPPLYQHTDPAQLPQDKLAAVNAWKYGPKGLLLVGPTGTGKTRCAWELLRRLIHEGRSVRVFDGLGWGVAVSAAFGELATTADWLDRVCKADVLFIDDLFKVKMTEAQEQAAYGVFERRTNHLLPIICTMNSTGRMILERMTDQGRADRGEPLIRRMAEFCEVVTF